MGEWVAMGAARGGWILWVMDDLKGVNPGRTRGSEVCCDLALWRDHVAQAVPGAWRWNTMYCSVMYEWMDGAQLCSRLLGD